MALVAWKAAVSGHWSNPTKWSTGEVPTSTDDAEINLVGNYTVSVTIAETANSLDFNAPRARLVESSTGKLALAQLTIENGYVELDAANTIGLTFVDGGVLGLGRTGALGSDLGRLWIESGELLSTASATLTEQLILSGPADGATTVTIAAAHATTLTVNSPFASFFGSAVTLDIGAPGVDGVVVWHTPSGSSGAPVAIDVRAGRFKVGDSRFFFLRTTVDAGAMIDLAGFSTIFYISLSGAGKIIDSGAAATLTLEDTDNAFSGSITGPLSLTVDGYDVLTGANTYTGSTTIFGDLVLGNNSTTGSIAAASPIVDNGTLTISHSNALTLANPISGSGVLVQEGTGTTTVTRANSYTGGTVIDHGTLAVGNAAALGSGPVNGVGTGGNAKLLGTITETLTNRVETSASVLGAFRIAAAHGTTLTLQGSAGWSLDPDVALHFGATGQDGTVIWFSPAGSTGHAAANDVDAGTLKAGDANLDLLLASAGTNVAAGARIDLAAFSTHIAGLASSGTITTSRGSPTLTLSTSGAFDGVISGAISLDAVAAQLTGANTYTGSTTISGSPVFGSGSLVLGNGGTTGSIAASSAIFDNGVLLIDRSNTVTLANPISGSGQLVQAGSGTTVINTVNTYSGGTTIDAGTLAIGNGGALGSGNLTIDVGEFEGTASIAFANHLHLIGSFAIAAAHGRTFSVGSGSWDLTELAGATISFGAAGQDGTVVWSQGSGAVITGSDAALKVRAGTLKAGDGGLAFLLQNVAATAVDAGASLDIAGVTTTINKLSGAGTVIDSGALAELTLQGITSFAGDLTGALSLRVDGLCDLRGLSKFTGGTTVAASQLLRNDGTFDLTTVAGVTAGGSGTRFVNNGLFEKTGGGTSTVSTPFVNNGQLVVTSGRVQFTGGFANVGVVQGVLSQNALGTTVTANAAGQKTFFGGRGDNLIKVTTAPTYVDGGAGFDTLEIVGNMTLAAGSVVNVEAIEVDNGVNANLSRLTAPYPITLLSVAGGGSTVTGTRGADTILGGLGNDLIAGGLGGDTLTGGAGSNRFLCLAIADSMPGADNFDRITDFKAGGGTQHDRIDLSKIGGVTTIQGLIKPTNPSETPPATGLHANSIAWYQFGSETVVLANASATANHVDMEIVLDGVTASALSTTAGVNFIPDPPAGSPHAGMALLVQSIAAGFGLETSAFEANANQSVGAAGDHQLLAPPPHA